MVVRYFLGAPYHLAEVHAGGLRELFGYALVGVIAGFALLLLDRFVSVVRARVIELPRWTYCLQIA
jgi:hypothetical protein